MGANQSQDSPFEIDKTNSQIFEVQSGIVWKLRHGIKKNDGSSVSIFSFEVQNNSNLSNNLVLNHLKRLKTLRHPNILSFLSSNEDSNGNINIVTESVIPLQNALQELNINQYPLYISWGLYQIIKALNFLHNECNLVHGNLTTQSIFVTKSGDWKIGCFELCCQQNDLTLLKSYSNKIISDQYKSPEYLKSNWDLIEQSGIWPLDIWMLACLIYEIFNDKLTKMELLKQTQKIPINLIKTYQQMLMSNPSSRLNTNKILECDYFDNNFVKTCLFLENITLKETYEKDKFFQKLEKSIDEFPLSITKYKILPHLVTALDFGSGTSRILAPLLKIGNHLTENEYSIYITPSIVKWFSSNDRSLRINLLQNLEHFIDHLTSQVINDQIFINVATGFTDTSPALRELTIKSMIFLVPKMSEQLVNSHVLKFFAKLQMDEEPGIRTNTTICLAKIASYLNIQTRNKILIPAFSRGLKDPFPKARIASLMAFSATQNYYSKEDCATKILPAISPMTIDNEKDVRELSFQIIFQFLKKLEKVSETGIEDTNVEELKKNNANVLGWAFNSITKKIYGDDINKNQNVSNENNLNQKKTIEAKENNNKPEKIKDIIQNKETNIESNGWDSFDEEYNDSNDEEILKNNHQNEDKGNWENEWLNDELDNNDDWNFSVNKNKNNEKILTKLEQKKQRMNAKKE